MQPTSDGVYHQFSGTDCNNGGNLAQDILCSTESQKYAACYAVLLIFPSYYLHTSSQPHKIGKRKLNVFSEVFW